MDPISACVLDIGGGTRIDSWLSALYPELSRGAVKRWIDAGVEIDGKRVKPSAKVSAGQVVTWTPSFSEVVDKLQAEAIDLDVVYADDDVIVLNKPAGLVMHPAAGNYSGTVLNALLNHFPATQNLPRAGIVHRLDKETSGLVMVAHSMRAHHSLVEQLSKRSVTRQYSAVVTGTVIAGGTIDQPIGRHPVDRKRQALRQDGKHAVTHYRVEQRYRAHAWLKVKLETGRTHQIRVHMASVRHILVGDRVYGYRAGSQRGANEVLNEQLNGFPRQALHAEVLGFTHPADGREMSFSAELPADMQQLIAALEADRAEHA